MGICMRGGGRQVGWEYPFLDNNRPGRERARPWWWEISLGAGDNPADRITAMVWRRSGPVSCEAMSR